jgi:hypothetical protein
VIGQLVEMMLGKVCISKYTDLGIPIVSVQINQMYIPNNLIDLGTSINVMTKETMEKHGLLNLIQTPNV